MSKRILRAGALALPFLTLSFSLIVACSDDDENPGTGRDASSDVAVLDGSNNTSDGSTIVDAGRDARDSSVVITDGGADADADADPPLPALCVTYPNTVLGVDASTEPEDVMFNRWALIAFRAVYSGAPSALNSCELSNYFGGGEEIFPPFPEECLGKQLAALTGCTLPAGPLVYDNTTEDSENTKCNPTGGVGSVQLGFQKIGTVPYTHVDVSLMIDLIVQAAVSTGMSTADAARLRTLLETKRNDVADGGDAGFSSPNCP